MHVSSLDFSLSEDQYSTSWGKLSYGFLQWYSFLRILDKMVRNTRPQSWIQISLKTTEMKNQWIQYCRQYMKPWFVFAVMVIFTTHALYFIPLLSYGMYRICTLSILQLEKHDDSPIIYWVSSPVNTISRLCNCRDGEEGVINARERGQDVEARRRNRGDRNMWGRLRGRCRNNVSEKIREKGRHEKKRRKKKLWMC